MPEEKSQLSERFDKAYHYWRFFKGQEDAKTALATILYELAHLVATSREIRGYSTFSSENFNDLKQEMVAQAWLQLNKSPESEDESDFLEAPSAYFFKIMANRAKTILGSKTENVFKTFDEFADSTFKIKNVDMLEELERKAKAIEEQKQDEQRTMTPLEYWNWLRAMISNLAYQLNGAESVKRFLMQNFQGYVENFRRNCMTAGEITRLSSLFPHEAMEIIDLGIVARDFPTGSSGDRELQIDFAIQQVKKKKGLTTNKGRTVPKYGQDAWDFMLEHGGAAMQSELVEKFGGDLKNPGDRIWDALQRLAKIRNYRIVRDTVGEDKWIKAVQL